MLNGREANQGCPLSQTPSTSLTAFHEVTAALVASLNLDDTLLAIARATTAILRADVGAIFLVDEGAAELAPKAVHGNRSRLWNDLRMDLRQGMNATALRTGRVVRIHDYPALDLDRQSINARAVALAEPIHSAMAAPVRRRGTAIATIGAYRRTIEPFDDESELLLGLLSDHAGVALDNALAYQELGAVRDRLQMAIEVAADFSATLDPTEVIRLVVVRATTAGQADRAVLLKVEGGDTVVEDFYDVNGSSDLVGYRHPIALQPLMRKAVTTRQPVIGGAFDAGRLESPLREALSEMRHTVTLPLLLEGQVNAVLVLSRRGDRPFRTADLSLFQLIGNQAVLALRNARLFAQARAVSTAQSDFLNMAAHELRTPLSVISGYVSMMEDGTLGPPPRAWLGPLETLRGKSSELDTLISELLAASRLEAGTMPIRADRIDLREAAFSAIERAGPRAALVGAHLGHRFPTAPVPASADDEQVGRILDNLLNNALSYGGDSPRVKVTVTRDPEPKVEVRDLGRGIAADQRERIFERFYRIEDPTQRRVPGTGLGLYISRQLAMRMGGSLELVRSSPGRGSRFALRLPAADGPQ